MDSSELLQKTAERLSPFETAHLVDFVRHLTVKSALSNPWIVCGFLIIAFYAVVVRSKFVLAALFTTISLLLLIRYTMPAEGDSLNVSSTLPFAFGGLAIGAFLIYLFFIKTE
ncbi:hypothetical protein KP004_01110 [Geomonas oryzisoli]|uniref:Uncharacterized protein n=1 Tax=Geomonas oryzisoli TaxID=2847992 RepID=A0ABX8JAS6_9BACT|nr:hypothetical protein [Geomonas oryzisoli]QWV93822.1 hypothetical protein KP004_01110 [Geomonas oryzisoli]